MKPSLWDECVRVWIIVISFTCDLITHSDDCYCFGFLQILNGRQNKTSLLGVVYTMDHKVVPRPCNICEWLLNSFRDHFGLHRGNVRVTMEFHVPKRHVLRPLLSTKMVQWVLWWERQKRYSSRKRQGPMVEKCCINKF